MKTILFFLALSLSSLAWSMQPIFCEIGATGRSILIEEKRVSILSGDIEKTRTVASAGNNRAAGAVKSVERVIFLENNKYYIHVENIDQFTDIDDYVTIQNLEGHKITYPISCSY